MKRETLSSISKVISDLFLIDGISPFGGISNMLYGLYDGFDYSDKIRSHEEMETIKEQRMDLYEKILNICKDIDTYPKHEYDVTEH